MSDAIKILIIVSVYIIGVIVTTLICYKLDTDDEDVIGIAWFWPVCLPLVVFFAILWLPVGIYKLLDGKPDKKDKSDYYDNDNWWEDENGKYDE